MSKGLWFWITIVLVAVALTGSAILLVDYVRPSPVFCAPDGGCGMVKRTIFAYPFGIPMPLIGTSYLFGLGIAASLSGRRARIAQVVLACVGGLLAIGLLVVQALIDQFCPYCVVVDSAIVALAVLSIARVAGGWDPPEGRKQVGLAMLVLVGAIVAPLVVGTMRKPLALDVPPAIAEEIGKTPKGKVTVVDFADFECPFCRMTHAELAPLVAERKEKVHVVRKQVPLRMHPHAMDAARAACCGEELGKGEEMADRLFTVDTKELTPEGCAKIAKELGLDPAKFDECVKSATTEERIKRDAAAFKESKSHGLPTIWVDKQKLEGSQDRETLRAVLDEAIRRL
jgi:protein-disulfide isomerase